MSGYKLVTPMTSRLTIFYNFIISFLPVFSLAPSTACRNLVPHQVSLEGKLRVLKTVPPENLKNSTFYGHLLESDRTVPQYKGNKHHFVIGIYRQNKDLDFQNKKTQEVYLDKYLINKTNYNFNEIGEYIFQILIQCKHIYILYENIKY